MDYKLEVLTLPVCDPDRAKAFYHDQLGFRLDADWAPDETFRVVQLTPPGSAASIQFGVGLTDAVPGSVRQTYLVVDDLEAAHRDLTERGVAPAGIVHKADRANWKGAFDRGVDPDRTDYASLFTFADPDGNSWTVQEIGHRQ